MLSYAVTVFNQIIIMFLLMLTGYLLFRTGKLTTAATAEISSILLTVVVPIVLMQSFYRDFDIAMAKQLLVCLVLSLLMYGVPIAIAQVFFRGDPVHGPDKIMCLVFSNNSFMAIPLLLVLLGSEGVFLGGVHIMVGTVLQWTFGVRVIGGKKTKMNVKKILLNPGVIGFVGGMVLFLLPIHLPATVVSVMGYIGNLNTPLAMLILGAYLAQVNLRQALRDKGMLLLTAIKLVFVPLLLVAVLWVLPLPQITATAMLIGSIAPTGIAAPMLMEIFHRDHRYCTVMVALTTLFSVITMPLILTLMKILP